MKTIMKTYILWLVILALYPSVLQVQAQRPATKEYYIRIDSIGRRSVIVGWRDMERSASTQEYIISLQDEYLDQYIFYFPIKGDTLNYRQVKKLKFQNPQKLYSSVQSRLDPSSGSTEKLPFKIYMVRPTESRDRYVKALLTHWSYWDYSKSPSCGENNLPGPPELF